MRLNTVAPRSPDARNRALAIAYARALADAETLPKRPASRWGTQKHQHGPQRALCSEQ